MRTKVLIGLLVVAVVFYSYAIGLRGVLLLRHGGVVGVLLGLALLVMPFLGLFLVVKELQFGRASQQLADQLEREGRLVVDDLPRRPSGRVERGAADALFARIRTEVDADPDDWRGWYRLAVAYDAAGDRTRARGATRAAIARWKAAPGR